MKKFRNVLLFIFMFMMGTIPVSAASTSYNVVAQCSFDSGTTSSTGTETCTILLEVKGSSNCNTVNISAELTNLTLASHADEAGWTFKDNGNGTYSFIYDGNNMPSTQSKVTTITFNKVKREEKCTLKLSNPSCSSQKITCKQEGDTYYGKDGSKVSKEQYELDCQTHKCEIVQGKYFGPDGKQTTESNYKLKCENVTCQKLPDGRYVDKSGKVVNYTEYRKSCETLSCEVLADGTRYGKNGNQVDLDTFRKECGDVCFKETNGTYHGKDGSVVDELTYQKQCGNNICQKYSDGTYSGPDGKEISQEEYQRQCLDEGPNTGASLPIATLTILLVTGIGFIFIANKSNKFN